MKTNNTLNMLTCVLFEMILVVYSHPDENLSITEMISKHNYPVEEHTIETSDGYLLKTFRIPFGRGNKDEPKKVVLIAHGLACSADDWVLLGPEALPYFLANNGFDVWLFNARGNRHSRKHNILDPDRDAKRFWNFCWQEIGVYDLPANINYILEHTNSEKIFYVGHSQGGTSCLVMLSELPEINDKITVAVLHAPAAYFEDAQNSFALKMSSIIYSPSIRYQKFYEFPPKMSVNTNDIAKGLCSNPGLKNMCSNMLYLGDHIEDHPIDKEIIPIIVQHTPSTFSTKQIHHYTQIMQSGEFKRFDYGEKRNVKLYGLSKPPYYNLSAITTPMALFYGTGDTLSSPMSVKKIGSQLENEHVLYEVPFDGFNHIDFLYARNAKKLVYEKTYEIFKKYLN